MGDGRPLRAVSGGSVARERARRTLCLAPREFALAVELGEVATAPPVRPGGRRRVPVSELARLRAEPGFPAPLRARLRLVGASEGAAELGISSARFTRLARAGCFGPAAFTVNRYRRLVWRYLAVELEQFGAGRPGLLHGALPRTVRELLAEGADCRARLWRARRVAQLLRQAGGPWSAAAVYTAVLPVEVVDEVVPDGRERLVLDALRPALLTARPASPTVSSAAAAVLTAQPPDEVHGHRLNLTLALTEARRHGRAVVSSAAARAEEPLLHDGDQQPPGPVVDSAAGQPPPTGRDG
ncbi:DUF6397 family protein [Streptomyces sp. JJ38]|uniref:DUF6397 family protein n=1 Tax=Streptomyces sp. JJ38 TaxID=2738128 RepID=UPI0027E1BB77|nr:DUF6397 family protein [Streptomyces sp. JJ38]